MKPNFLFLTTLSLLVSILQSCAVVGGIFKAGTAAGVIIVVIIIAVIAFIVSRLFKK